MYEAGYVYDSVHAYLLAINASIYTTFKHHILNTIRRNITGEITASNITQLLEEHNITYKMLMDVKLTHNQKLLAKKNWTFPITWYSNYSNVSPAPVNMSFIVKSFVIPKKFQKHRVMESFRKLRYEGKWWSRPGDPFLVLIDL